MLEPVTVHVDHPNACGVSTTADKMITLMRSMLTVLVTLDRMVLPIQSPTVFRMLKPLVLIIAMLVVCMKLFSRI